MWTVDDHLRDKPEAIRALFEAVEQTIKGCGTYERSVTKTAIAYKGPVRGFAGVTPRRQHLTGFLDLSEEVHEQPLTRVTPYTNRLWVHRFVVEDLRQLEAGCDDASQREWEASPSLAPCPCSESSAPESEPALATLGKGTRVRIAQREVFRAGLVARSARTRHSDRQTSAVA